MTPVAIHDRHVDNLPELECQKFLAGAQIFREGGSSQIAYIVHSGLVEISKIHSTGESVIGYIGAGEIFGEMAPIDAEPRMASARALRDTICVIVPKDLFREKVEHADPFIRDVFRVLVQALRSVSDRMA
jgi:CRP/FNR family cyclic AMP-dependent transcriptional regulator